MTIAFNLPSRPHAYDGPDHYRAIKHMPPIGHHAARCEPAQVAPGLPGSNGPAFSAEGWHSSGTFMHSTASLALIFMAINANRQSLSCFRHNPAGKPGFAGVLHNILADAPHKRGQANAFQKKAVMIATSQMQCAMPETHCACSIHAHLSNLAEDQPEHGSKPPLHFLHGMSHLMREVQDD